MHRCLYISEVLGIIFKFVEQWDHQPHEEARVGKKTLASLARTCCLFSSPALDVLWHDLDSLNPLLQIFPIVTSSVDDQEWSTFHKYAKRVKTMRGCEGRIPPQVRQDFITSVHHYPEAYLPLLPNATKLEWSELCPEGPRRSGISLLKYFASPSVTKITLCLLRGRARPPAELAVLADLPRLCPRVSSFTVIFRLWRLYVLSTQEIGRMVTQWPRLRTLRTCVIPQVEMDQLFSMGVLESLHIDCYHPSLTYIGRIPNTVRKFRLTAEGYSLCIRFLETVYASPTKFRLVIKMDDEQEEASHEHERMFHLLSSRLDTSRLRSLTIQPRMRTSSMPILATLELRAPFVSALVGFTVLHELDLDLLCTEKMTDADFARLAGSLTRLRSLKLGTANASTSRPRPVASIAAVITVLRCCERMKTLHMVFDGTIHPPEDSVVLDGELAFSEAPVGHGWDVSNRRITKLCVGRSPIGDAAIDVVASCFKAIMPCLVEIQSNAWEKEWELVQNILGSE